MPASDFKTFKIKAQRNGVVLDISFIDSDVERARAYARLFADDVEVTIRHNVEEEVAL